MTRQQYMESAAKHGRVTPPAERIAKIMSTKRAAPTAKVTEAQVQEIVRRRKAGETLKAIAADFGVHYSYVGHICTGRSWAPPPHPVTKAPRRLGKYEVEHPPLIFSSLRIGSYLRSNTAISRAYGG